MEDLIKIREKHFLKYNEFNVQEEPIVTLEQLSLYYKELSKINGKIRILELGTKRSKLDNPTHHKTIFSDIDNLEYIMSDYADGLDVDIVCDLHNTTGVFANETFDLIISCSTYEHLKYPLLCSHNLMKMLKIGGRIFIQTHQTFPLHGYKYDYYRFSKESLKSIFSYKMNFTTISSYFEHPSIIVPHNDVHDWNLFAESYLNVVYVGEKTGKTPIEYIYDLDNN
jgi:hypothetical protein